ncbi:MAG TPA: hypothetical protein VN613_11485 [Gemmatimonadaceae bacterium]|nr:hypothetical protein [Gemmatimonadaceae bacterium]
MEVLHRVRPPRLSVSAQVHPPAVNTAARIRTRAARTLLAAVLTICASLAFAAPCAAQLPGTTVRSLKWPIRTREYVDLWLHGFAMISADSATVPLFRRGYQGTLTMARTKAAAVTDLDVNHDALAKHLRENPALINAQFLAFAFTSWDDLVAAVDAFVKANGDPKRARSREEAAEFAEMARLFPNAADRDFARMFTNSLQNEKDVFFHAWWVDEMRRRAATLAAVDSIWQAEMLPRLQGFLNNAGMPQGDLILSLAIEGEGRTVTNPRDRSQVAVGFPDSPADAMDAMYALAHEIVGPLTGPAVDDNTTPAEKRSGLATTIGSYALVRGGELVLAHLSPALGTGYAKFYLGLAGVTYEGDPMPAFAKTFSIPGPMLNSIARQVAISFGGI